MKLYSSLLATLFFFLMTTQPISLTELKKRRQPIRNVNRTHHESLTLLEKFALWITEHVGSMKFFILLFVWTAGWFGWNVFGPSQYRFDPFPSFVLWLFISNVTQLFLLPLILIGQNLGSRHSEVRAENDFEVNRKSEREIEVVLEHLEYQQELLKALGGKLDKP